MRLGKDIFAYHTLQFIDITSKTSPCLYLQINPKWSIDTAKEP